MMLLLSSFTIDVMRFHTSEGGTSKQLKGRVNDLQDKPNVIKLSMKQA